MKKIELDKIAYLHPPVPMDLKKKLNSEGFKIIDARFAPEGAEIYGGAVTEADHVGAASLTDDELRAAITEATGKAPHHKLGREKLIEAYNASARTDDVPNGEPTAIPEAWEAMTDDELLALAAELSGGEVVATENGTPVERARAIIGAAVADRAGRA